MDCKLSVLVSSFRPGGMDITFRALRDQTCKDFEVIIADRRYEKRHDAVMKLAAESGVPTIHVPEHRRNGKWAVLAAAWNTAIMLARGKYIVFLPDYSYVPPEWVEQHLELHAIQEAVILCPYRMYAIPPVVDKAGQPVEPVPPDKIGPQALKTKEMPDDTFDEISIFPQPFDPSWLPSLVPWPDEKQCPRRGLRLLAALPPMCGHFHMRNESLLRQLALQANGFDETLDRGKSHIDLEFGRRLNTLQPILPSSAPEITMLDPHGLFITMPQYGPGRWTGYQCSLYATSTNTTMAPNPYSLMAKAVKLSAWRTLDRVPTDDLDVADRDYYQW